MDIVVYSLPLILFFWWLRKQTFRADLPADTRIIFKTLFWGLLIGGVGYITWGISVINYIFGGKGSLLDIILVFFAAGAYGVVIAFSGSAAEWGWKKLKERESRGR